MWFQWDFIQRPNRELVLDLRCWAVGIYWDYGLIGANLGPLGFVWRTGDNRFKQFCRSWMVIEKRVGRINLHLDIDSYTWRIGYIAAATWDHGLYLGPANLQFEYDRWNDESA